MSFGALAAVLGTVLGGVLALLVVGLIGLWLVMKLDASIAGVPRVHAALIARGMDRRLADRIRDELELTSGGVGCGAVVGLVGLAALATGGYFLFGMYRPEPLEWLLYLAPGVVVTGIALVMVVRARRVDPDTSELHRRLVTEGPRVRVLVRATVRTRVNITTAGDALAGQRVTQMQLLPHVIVVHEDGTELAIRALEDADVVLTETVRALQGVVPHARVTADVVLDYHAGSGRAFLAAPAAPAA